MRQLSLLRMLGLLTVAGLLLGLESLGAAEPEAGYLPASPTTPLGGSIVHGPGHPTLNPTNRNLCRRCHDQKMEGLTASACFGCHVQVGWANLSLEGNRRRYQQYVTPPTGLYLSEAGVQRWEADGDLLLDLRVQNPWQVSAAGDLWLATGSGAVLRGTQRRSAFFPDWEEGTESLTRRDGRYDLTAPLRHGDLRFSYREGQVAHPSGAPQDTWRDRTAGGELALHAGKWQGQLTYQSERFSFPEGGLFNGNATTTQLRVTAPSSERTFVEGTAAMTRTSLESRREAPRSYRLALQGGQVVNPDLTLRGELARYRVTRSLAQTAYAKGGSNAALSAQYGGLWRTTLEVGGGLRNVEYLDRTQRESVSANVHSWYAKAVTRFSRALRLKAAQTRWWTTNRPVAFDLGGDPEAPLVWSTKMDRRVSLSYAPDWRLGMTASWRGVEWENSNFASRTSLIEQAFFGWWLPSERLTTYCSLLRQDFGLRGPFAGGLYTTDNRTSVVGATYQFSPALLGELAFTRSESRGALGTDQRVLSAGLAHQWPSGDRLSARVVLDDFCTSQAAPDFNYDADRFELRYTRSVF